MPLTHIDDIADAVAKLDARIDAFDKKTQKWRAGRSWDCVADALDDLGRRFDDMWKESDHPRDLDGQFGSGGGSSGSSGGQSGVAKRNMKETKSEGKTRTQANGEPLPTHIQALKIPPAWTDVRYDDTAGAGLLAVGKDAKGRPQSIYSAEHTAKQAAVKFSRIHELNSKIDEIASQNAAGRTSSDKKIREAADCLDLIMKMGVRPGSDTDTGAKVKAYGATTLEGRHVVETADGVRLKFIGKKGVALDLPVHDRELASALSARAKASGNSGRLFGDLNDAALRDYVHTLDGGGFKTKDFRTHVGTSTAAKLVESMDAPKDEKSYRKAVMEVAKKVSEALGNTPTIALQSYISPTVFSSWRIAA